MIKKFRNNEKVVLLIFLGHRETYHRVFGLNNLGFLRGFWDFSEDFEVLSEDSKIFLSR
jgi:hypothetical protein